MLAPRTTLGICLIGAGFMGRAHSAAYRHAMAMPSVSPGIRLQTIVGLNAEQRDTVRDLFGWHAAASDWRAAVRQPDIDIVDVATPTNLHAEIAIAAAESGKHVLCEKPLAMMSAETERMLAAVRKAKVRHAVAFNYRFVPALALARQLIEEGRLGMIRHFRARYLQDWLVDPLAPMTWRLDKETAGSGVHGDLNAHLIDLAHFLVGPIDTVVGDSMTFVRERHNAKSGLTGSVTVDDATSFLARFRGGAMGVFEASRMATGSKNRNQLEIEGDRGAIGFDLERLNELQFYSTDDPPHVRGFRTILVTEPDHPHLADWWPPGHMLGWEHAHAALIGAFLNDIETGSSVAPTFEDGVACQRVLEAVELSTFTRQWVSAGCS